MASRRVTLRNRCRLLPGADALRDADFYLDPSYRGTGLADDLFARAIQHAREDGAEELDLRVDANNDRALAYYEKRGFDIAKYRMRVAVEDVLLDTDDGSVDE